MGKIKHIGKPLRCDKQYRKRSDQLSKLFPSHLGLYRIGAFELIYCRDSYSLCGFRGKEKECPNYEVRLR